MLKVRFSFVNSNEFRTFASTKQRDMKLKEIIDKVNAHIETETNISLELPNGLKINVSGYSHLAQTCWLSFIMPNLGKRLGKEWIKDVYDIELAQWNICYKIEEVLKKLDYE